MSHDPFARSLGTHRSAGLRILLGTALVEGVRLLLLWRHRIRSRQRLAELPPHLLRDVGLSPAEARREAARFFWQGGAGR